MGSSKNVQFERDWPSPTEDGKIPTRPFLETCEVVLQVLSLLGHLFTPMRNDVEGNLTKLNSKYSQDPEKHATLHDMISVEVSSPSTAEPSAMESLKWLKRGLHFVYLLLDDLVHSYEQKIGEKELVVVCQDAYEISLKNYHNWMIQKLAVACIRTVCPHRKDFIQSLQNGTAGQSEEMLFQRMKRFVNGLEVNLQIIFLLYVDTGLDTVSSLK